MPAGWPTWEEYHGVSDRDTVRCMSEIPTPSPSRIVMLKGARVATNGTDRCPAIVTRVWGTEPSTDGSWTLNTTAFPDAAPSHAVTSVKLFVDEAAADAYLDTCGPEYRPTVAFWPARS